MYYGAHSIRFYPNENYVGEFAFGDPDNHDYCPDTWETWHLIPTGKVIFAPPEVEDGMLKIPGRNGLVNVNKYTTGKSVFGARTGTIEFALDPEYVCDWPVIYSDILRYFHGRERCAVLRDDRYFYYKGWFSVSDLQPGEYWDTVTISYQLDPFKYERWASDNSQWMWDDFDFRYGAIREYRSIGVPYNGGQATPLTIHAIHPFGEAVIPKFKAYNRNSLETESTGALAAVMDAVQMIPIRWEASRYGEPIYSTAKIVWPDSPAFSQLDPNDENDWLTAFVNLMAPGNTDSDGKLKTLNDAVAAITLNEELQTAKTDAINVLKEMYDIANASAPTTADQIIRVSNFKDKLPEAARLLHRINEAVMDGAVQASADGETWKNVYTAEQVQYPEISLNGREPYEVENEELEGGTEAVLLLRTTFDTDSIDILPSISVSIRGNML